jgi:hypothetical protein
LVTEGDDATISPPGNGSENVTPVSGVDGFGLVKVKVNVVVAPVAIVDGVNALVRVGGPTTVTDAFAVPALVRPAAVVNTLLLLFLMPVVVPLTFTVIEQLLDAGIVPPDSAIEPLPAVAVTLPPHVLVKPFGVATTSPAGSESLNTAPVRGCAFGFASVNVRLVDELSGIAAFPNALLIVGGLPTTSVALAVLPWPPFVELTAPVVLIFVPTVVPCTCIANAHGTLTVAFAKDTPAAVTVTIPPQTGADVVVAVTPGGNRSENETPVKVVDAFGLVIKKFSCVVPFSATADGAKNFEICGGATTVRSAVDGKLVPPSVDDAVTVLVFFPAVVPVTFSWTEQLVLAPIDPSASDTVPEPGVAVTGPSQLLDALLGVATTKPAGRLSVNATPVAAEVVALVNRKLRIVEPPWGIDVTLNPLEIVGGSRTVSSAEAMFDGGALAEVTGPAGSVHVPPSTPVTST